MNIRTLIANAIHASRAEFETILVRRIADLMGDPPVTAKAKAEKRAATTKPKANAKPAVKGAKAASTKRGPAGPVDDVLLRVLSKGDAMGKSAIMKGGGYSAKDDTRVGLGLVRLRTAGKIAMSGTRRGATYQIQAAA